MLNTGSLASPASRSTDTRPNPRVVVGLSGGVDSSTAAAVLKQQGYEVVGVTLWLMQGKGQCCSEGLVDAVRLCDQLGIEHHIVDSRDVFSQEIVDFLVAGYADGTTPLPCSRCNKAVKFNPLIYWAQTQFGIERIATGHYARVLTDAENGRVQLLRAVDRHKDQSYFLYDLSQAVLARVMFPLGEWSKTETRKLAAAYNLATADKPESQDLCLVEAHGSMRDFLEQYLAPQRGEIVDLNGKVLGYHDGIHHYTIGQRKGLGVAAAQPLYVVKLDQVMNRVVVGDRETAVKPEAWVQQVNWVSIANPSVPFDCTVQVRYRSEAVPVRVTPLNDGRVHLQFAEPQFGVTPGQAAVWYEGERVLGGGLIERFAD